MSDLASKLPTPEQLTDRIRKGPTGACDVYGPGDMDDWRAVEAIRLTKSWAVAQRAVDDAKGFVHSIDEDKFRYHWRLKCWHWTTEQRRDAAAEVVQS